MPFALCFVLNYPVQESQIAVDRARRAAVAQRVHFPGGGSHPSTTITKQHQQFVMVKELRRTAETIRVLVTDPYPLFLEGMAAILRHSRYPLFEPIVVPDKLLEAVGSQQMEAPHLLWCRMTSEFQFVKQAGVLRRAYPSAHLVVIDEMPNDGRISTALQVGAKGYLCTNQSAEDITAQLSRAAQGEWSFAPRIASRVHVTPEGAALKPSPSAQSLSMLSPREREVMTHLAHGYSPKQCADRLGLALSTVDNHKTRVMKKLQVRKSTQLVLLAVQLGLVEADFMHDI